MRSELVARTLRRWTAAAVIVLLAPLTSRTGTAAVMTTDDVLKTRRATEAQISPNGRWIAYTVRRTRAAGDKAGSDYRELHVVSSRGGDSRPFVTGKVGVSSLRWRPDGAYIAFRMKRGEKAKTQVWMIPADGGEAFEVTNAPTSVLSFRWHPDGDRLAYVAVEPPTAREKALKKKGYGFTYFEENLKHRNLYTVAVDPSGKASDPERVTRGITIWTFDYSPDGTAIAAGASEKNLIDYRYAFQKVYIINPASGEARRLTDNPGKIGRFAFSPDGTRLAYVAGRNQRDHNVSHAYVIPVAGGEALDLTRKDFRGHINWVGWKDKDTILYRAGEGMWNTLNLVKAKGGEHKTILHSKKSGVIFGAPSYTRDFKKFAMVGSATDVPSDVYHWTPGRQLERLTHLNPWIAERDLGRQEVIRYKARDGLEIEGLLYYPVGYREGSRYPLVVIVHGGPESHYTNGWNVRYSSPTQVLAGKGYAVFLPNYRSSTGYGVDFTSDHLGDAAGKEFDDIADGIDHLVKTGIADRDRVGLGGGSYGGYAAAWFSSYYTKYVRAVCMFVGISNLVSKRSTTDIPYEELFVHSGKPLEEMWQLSLERSPVYYARQSRSAVLIYGGEADPRVHPSQSLEYYRRLKVNGHPAVRLVRYPGEGHGNARQPGKIDVLHRTLQWYDWYVRDAKPFDGPMPPLDISDTYGIELGETEKAGDVTMGE
ncbi:MAG: S9 family peptidase [Candidatus Krumholzibacteriia bacterium]